ncbi:MAG: hypothetical protein V1819_02405 [bacterium]
MEGTIITFNVGACTLLVGIFVFFFALLGIIWKGKKEIADTVKSELNPFRNIANAITEIQTIMRNKFIGINIVHTMVEKGESPLNPTLYGANLIKDSGLEKILNDNKELLFTKITASLPTKYTDYDVQEKARELLISLKKDPLMFPVKNWVYNNPMDIDIILRVGGLWLRDDFLNKPRKTSE